MKSILFICTGNTCRSPMAAGIFNYMVKSEGISATADSAGISAAVGSPPSPNAVEVCRENGIDISMHKSRSITLSELEIADLICVMTPMHAQIISEICIDTHKIFIPEFPVSDPYGGDITVYRKCFNELHSLCRELIQHLFL